MTESFAVRIGIDTPLSLRGLLHLDGLLGSLAVARGREATNIPLLKHEGIWQGSAAIPLKPVPSVLSLQANFVSSM